MRCDCLYTIRKKVYALFPRVWFIVTTPMQHHP